MDNRQAIDVIIGAGYSAELTNLLARICADPSLIEVVLDCCDELDLAAARRREHREPREPRNGCGKPATAPPRSPG